MSLAFDTNSLNAAANLIVSVAATKGQETISLLGSNPLKKYDLRVVNEVLEYLKDRTEKIYNESNPIAVASIADVPYFSVGVVFENMPDKIYPNPPTRGQGAPKHIACFWQAL